MTRASVLAALLLCALASGAAGAVVGAPADPSADTDRQPEPYVGSNVSVEIADTAVTDYAVDGTVLLVNVSVEPVEDVYDRGEFAWHPGKWRSVDLQGASLSVQSRGETDVQIGTEDSATLRVHDTERGILTVHAGEEPQIVDVDVPSDASVASEGDDTVVVNHGNRTGAFVVVGGGTVDRSEDGGLSARLYEGASLAFRAYDRDERDAAARTRETLIANGTATVEAYADVRDGKVVTGAATYAADVTADVRIEDDRGLLVTVDRVRSDGTVVLTSVGPEAVDGVEAPEDLEVSVDGDAATEVSSYGELREGVGDEPRYLVRQSGNASTAADVLVAIDHFSEREIAIHSSDRQTDDGGADGGADGGSSTDEGADDGSDDASAVDGSDGDGSPGFGAGAALVAMALACVCTRLRR